MNIIAKLFDRKARERIAYLELKLNAAMESKEYWRRAADEQHAIAESRKDDLTSGLDMGYMQGVKAVKGTVRASLFRNLKKYPTSRWFFNKAKREIYWELYGLSEYRPDGEPHCTDDLRDTP